MAGGMPALRGCRCAGVDEAGHLSHFRAFFAQFCLAGVARRGYVDPRGRVPRGGVVVVVDLGVEP
jgi:hypothetical protein